MTATLAAPHLRAGEEAELIARRYLENKGLRVVSANYRCRRGELDLIMNDGTQIVFVEIRYRRSARIVRPVETVDRRKRGRIATAARHFLQRNRNYGDNPVRFDVIGVTGSLDSPGIEWIRNAFSTEDL